MSEISIKIVSWVGRLLVILIGRTLKIKYIGSFHTERAIYAFWHGDFFPLIYANRNRRPAVLVSTHRDGEYLSRVIGSLGYETIRGSSDESGARGVLQILKSNANGIAIAPDGPKGPAKQVKEGISKIAQITGLPVVPVGVCMSHSITLGSWDKFKIPFPFSRCIVYFGKPIPDKESTKIKVESALIEVNECAYRLRK